MDFSVDPAGLRSGGRGVEGDLRRLRDETAAGGPAAWGTELGPVAAYEELTRVTAEALDLIGAVLAKSGAGTQQMADAYEHADGAARDGFGRIGGPA